MIETERRENVELPCGVELQDSVREREFAETGHVTWGWDY